jgi:hypothetical protein
MLQRAAQNVYFVAQDKSGGLHNPAYALAGLRKATMWARSATATIDASMGAGPTSGAGETVVGTLKGLKRARTAVRRGGR